MCCHNPAEHGWLAANIPNPAVVSKLQLILKDARHFVSLAKPSQSFIKLHGKVNLCLDIQYD